jgi:hypothetical protein
LAERALAEARIAFEPGVASSLDDSESHFSRPIVMKMAAIRITIDEVQPSAPRRRAMILSGRSNIRPRIAESRVIAPGMTQTRAVA